MPDAPERHDPYGWLHAFGRADQARSVPWAGPSGDARTATDPLPGRATAVRAHADGTAWVTLEDGTVVWIDPRGGRGIVSNPEEPGVACVEANQLLTPSGAFDLPVAADDPLSSPDGPVYTRLRFESAAAPARADDGRWWVQSVWHLRRDGFDHSDDYAFLVAQVDEKGARLVSRVEHTDESRPGRVAWTAPSGVVARQGRLLLVDAWMRRRFEQERPEGSLPWSELTRTEAFLRYHDERHAFRPPWDFCAGAELVVVAEEGVLHAFGSNDGAPVWQVELPGLAVSPALDGLGRTWVGTPGGLLVLGPDGRVSGRFDTGPVHHVALPRPGLAVAAGDDAVAFVAG